MKKKIISIIGVAIIAVSIITCANLKKITNHQKINSIQGHALEITNSGIIFIGDNRIQQMYNILQNENANITHDSFIIKSDNNKFYQNMSLIVKNKIEDKPEYNRWKIIINLGITDYNNIDQNLINKINYLIDNDWKFYQVYITSIGPVESYKMNDNGYNKIDNLQIEEFNNSIKDKFPHARFINTYQQILESYDTTDGVNYTRDTNIDLYNYIMKFIF